MHFRVPCEAAFEGKVGPISVWAPTPERFTLLLQSLDIFRQSSTISSDSSAACASNPAHAAESVSIRQVKAIPPHSRLDSLPWGINNRGSHGSSDGGGDWDQRNISGVEDSTLMPFNTERDILSQQYVLTSSKGHGFVMKIYPDGNPFHHPAMEMVKDDRKCLQEIVRHAIDNEIGAMIWAKLNRKEIKVPPILGYAFYGQNANIESCLDIFGILGFIIMELPSGGVLYEGPAYECRLEEPKYSAFINSLAKLVHDMRRDPKGRTSGFTTANTAIVHDDNGGPQSPRTRSRFEVLGRGNPTQASEHHHNPRTPASSAIDMPTASPSRKADQSSYHNLNAPLRCSLGSSWSSFIDIESNLELNAPPSSPLLSRYQSTQHLPVAKKFIRSGSDSPFAKQSMVPFTSPPAPCPDPSPDEDQSIVSSDSDLQEALGEQLVQSAHLHCSRLSDKDIADVQERAAQFRNLSPCQLRVQLPQDQLSLTPKSALEACRLVIQADHTNCLRIRKVTSLVTLKADTRILAPTAVSQQVSVEELAAPVKQSWFDRDPTVYCSMNVTRQALEAHVDRVGIAEIVYDPSPVPAASSSPAAAADGSYMGKCGTASASLYSTKPKRLFKRWTTSSKHYGTQSSKSWMIESFIHWPTQFVYPPFLPVSSTLDAPKSYAHDGHLSVIAYEHQQLLNALVALGRLDSHPGSTCRFPKALLGLLRRVLVLAHDELLFHKSGVGIFPRRRVLSSSPPLPLLSPTKGSVTVNQRIEEPKQLEMFEPRSIFTETRTVFTHRHLDPSSVIIRRDTGEILALLNFEHAGFLPTYVEDFQGPFVETSTRSSFWKVGYERYESRDDESSDDNQDRKNRKTGQSRRSVPFLASRRKQRQQPLLHQCKQEWEQSALEPPSHMYDDIGMIISPQSAQTQADTQHQRCSSGSNFCPSFSRRGRHPIPYPVINQYSARSGTFAACRMMGYSEAAPSRHSSLMASRPKASRFNITTESSGSAITTFTSHSPPRGNNVSASTKSCIGFSGNVANLASHAPTKGRCPSSQGKRDAALVVGSLIHRSSLALKPLDQTSFSSFELTKKGRVGGCSGSIQQYQSPAVCGRVTVRRMSVSTLNPQKEVAGISARNGHTIAGTCTSGVLSPGPGATAEQVAGGATMIGGTLVPKSPKVDQVGWFQFLDSYRKLKQSDQYKNLENGWTGTRVPVEAVDSPYIPSPSPPPPASARTSFRNSFSNLSSPSSTNHWDSKLLDQQEEHKVLEAFLCVSKTLQNLVVVLEAGGIVLTRDQLLNNVALKREEWKTNKQRELEGEVQQQRRKAALLEAASDQKQSQSPLETTTSSTLCNIPPRLSPELTQIKDSDPAMPTKPAAESQDSTSQRRRGLFKSIVHRMNKIKTKHSSSSLSSSMSTLGHTVAIASSGSSITPTRDKPLPPTPELSSYCPTRTSHDNILYSAPGVQRDPLPSELPEHLLLRHPSSTYKNTRALDSNHLQDYHYPLSSAVSASSFTTILGLRLRPGGQGTQEVIVPLAPNPRLGSIVVGNDIPVYGIRLSNADRTLGLAQIEMEKIEQEEDEFWKEFEGLCETPRENGDRQGHGQRRNSNGHCHSCADGGSGLHHQQRDETIVDPGSNSNNNNKGEANEVQESEILKECYPGVALLDIEDLEQNLEVVERHVLKLEKQAAVFYTALEHKYASVQRGSK
ncbi:hypothetical protein EDD11_003768 [Mortierella claussenii]|nr:hypothetical protein EDD11_003768 [Mortierella claussenii]